MLFIYFRNKSEKKCLQMEKKSQTTNAVLKRKINKGEKRYQPELKFL